MMAAVDFPLLILEKNLGEKGGVFLPDSNNPLWVVWPENPATLHNRQKDIVLRSFLDFYLDFNRDVN